MEDRCVCCGRVIPEGRQVCPICAADLPPQARKTVERLEEFGIDIQASIEYIKSLIQPVIDVFTELWNQLQETIFYFDEEEIPKMPYSFNSKVRIYDKRPHKQHRIRNNCRKERFI